MVDEQTEQTQTTEEEKTTTEQTQQTQDGNNGGNQDDKPDFMQVAQDLIDKALENRGVTQGDDGGDEDDQGDDEDNTDKDKENKRLRRELEARKAYDEVIDKNPSLKGNEAARKILTDMRDKGRPANEIREHAKNLSAALGSKNAEADREAIVKEVATDLQNIYEKAYGKPGVGAGNAVNAVSEIKKVTNVKDLVKDAEKRGFGVN